jgi:hypothetical protein
MTIRLKKEVKRVTHGKYLPRCPSRKSEGAHQVLLI